MADDTRCDLKCLSMILCEHVHASQHSGQHTIVGTLDDQLRLAGSLPAHLQLTVFCELTEGHGDYLLRIRISEPDFIVDPSKASDATARSIHFENPLQVVRMIFSLRLSVTRPGPYFFELVCEGQGDEVVASRRLVIHSQGN